MSQNLKVAYSCTSWKRKWHYPYPPSVSALIIASICWLLLSL